MTATDSEVADTFPQWDVWQVNPNAKYRGRTAARRLPNSATTNHEDFVAGSI
jgi:hypothetical protein